MVNRGPAAPEDREFAVVGAGLLGLATARELAARGRDVVVFERAEVGHRGGGSHGNARIFRLGYPDSGYVAMAKRARGLWRELESAAGEQLLVPAGQLTFGAGLDDFRRALTEAGAPCEWLPAGAAADRFPAVTAEGPCLYEPESAVIAADRVLAALAAAVPEIRAGLAVSRLEADDGRVTLTAGEMSVRARAAVVCAGHWTGPLLAGAGCAVPGTATLEQVAYVAPARGPADGQTSRPIFINFGDRSPYGLPVPGSGLYKVGVHPGGTPGRRGMVGPAITPGDETGGEDPALRAEIMSAVTEHLPGYDPTPVQSERCVYDNAPDEDFVVDRAGALVIGCGTSGHGFKFGPLLGEWLADLAVGVQPRDLPARFGLSRFTSLC